MSRYTVTTVDDMTTHIAGDEFKIDGLGVRVYRAGKVVAFFAGGAFISIVEDDEEDEELVEAELNALTDAVDKLISAHGDTTDTTDTTVMPQFGEFKSTMPSSVPDPAA